MNICSLKTEYKTKPLLIICEKKKQEIINIETKTNIEKQEIMEKRKKHIAKYTV